jgi:hypothetical protein
MSKLNRYAQLENKKDGDRAPCGSFACGIRQPSFKQLGVFQVYFLEGGSYKSRPRHEQ